MMKWREIRSDPPEGDYGWVLACDSSNPDELSISAQYSGEQKEFFNIIGNVYLRLEGISHWMPLPSFEEAK